MQAIESTGIKAYVHQTTPAPPVFRRCVRHRVHVHAAARLRRRAAPPRHAIVTPAARAA